MEFGEIFGIYSFGKKYVEANESEILGKIERLKKELEKEQARLEAWEKKKPHWIYNLLHPLLIEMAVREPRIRWKELPECTYGLRAETTVFGYFEKSPISITLTSLDTLSFDTEERTYNENDPSGLKNKTVKVESVQQVIDFIKRQIDNSTK